MKKAKVNVTYYKTKSGFSYVMHVLVHQPVLINKTILVI